MGCSSIFQYLSRRFKTHAKPVAQDIPPSQFTPLCHPNEKEVSASVDNWFLTNWEFGSNEKARKKFIGAGFSRVTCMYFPKALDDRIAHACKLLTILFLVDDQLEHMSLAEGEAYNEHLMSFCRGDVLPDRKIPVEWMMYDIWDDMRQCDKDLANDTLEPVFLFMRAQTSRERLHVKGLGPYLEYRQGDVGQALLAALMRFSMNLRLSTEEIESVRNVELNVGRHIAIVNDIFSFEKELAASKTAHKEGAYLCSAVSTIAEEVNIKTDPAKRILFALCREWESLHTELVNKRKDSSSGCSMSLKAYMNGLEYQMSGNELWSRTTKRYASPKA